MQVGMQFCPKSDFLFCSQERKLERRREPKSSQAARSKATYLTLNTKPSKRNNVLSSLSKNLKIKIYKTIILPVVLYGCETWYLTLREESRLRVFENRILKRKIGPKIDENENRRRLHNEKLYSFYRSPDIVKVNNLEH